MFKQSFKFQLPNGYSSLPSFPGFTASLLLILLTISYGVVNLIEMQSYGQTTVKINLIDYYYKDTDKFDVDKNPGLNIAFGITHYNNVSEPIDDPDYGEVVGIVK